MRLLSLLRYRFFLIAGLAPYLLGAAWAYGREGVFSTQWFLLGLLGVALAVLGVECFNEHFDARLGTDRIFDPGERPAIPDWVFPLGSAAFGGAALVGLFLAKERGWPVLAYAALGGLAAAFYEGPPFRWAYRGLGEVMIAFSYGPWMMLASLWLQTRSWSWPALAASFVPGLLIAALAVANEVPDFYQDRMVGKKNLVVRLGRRTACRLYLGLAGAAILLIALGVAAAIFSPVSLIALAPAPLLLFSARIARTEYDSPPRFIPAIRSLAACYALGTAAFALAVGFG